MPRKVVSMNGRSLCKKACAVVVVCAAMAIDAPAQVFTSLTSFRSGANPEYVSLIQGKDGNLFGTTAHYGSYGGGTVFEISSGGTFNDIYDFCYYDCEDGGAPAAGVVQGLDGALYGTTSAGGVFGYGTFFKITSVSRLTTLHSFSPYNGDGSGPGGLVQAIDGNFYGATYAGYSNGAIDYGQVFRITPGGTLTTLHIFEGPDGAYPYDALVQATNGNFYGTTF